MKEFWQAGTRAHFEITIRVNMSNWLNCRYIGVFEAELAYIMPDIEPSSLKEGKLYRDLEKSVSSLDETNPPLYPAPKPLKRKLIIYLLIESTISLSLYYNYNLLINIHPLVAPTLLGSSTAALAQSINQYFNKKLNFRRVCKFVVWGSINGLFTALWVELLMSKFDKTLHRIFVDQLVGAPTFQMVFNVLSSLWENGEISASTRQKYIKSLKYSYCYWPLFSIGTFIYIPKNMIVPANCLANLVWNIILSKLS